MEKEKLNQELEDRLLAYFNGELNEEEAGEVERWIAGNKENEDAYHRSMKLYLHLRWAQKEQQVDAVKAKRELFRKLDSGKIRKMWFGLAASIAVMIAVGGLYMLTNHQPENMTLSQVEVITPGSTQAKLILSSGEEIDLSKGGQNAIQEQDGSMVTVDSNRGIVYDRNELAKGGKIIYNKIVVPRGGEYFVTLCDGTKVWLNAESELEYPVNFTGDMREVKLKGEAYFSVTKDAKKPFIVRAGEYRLRVYGTEFNLNAYQQREVQAVLVEGSISFRANAQAPERRLKPNQLGVVDMVTGEVQVKDVEVYPYIAWRNQDMVFVNERLESIMEKTARWYDVTVFFQNEKLKDLRFYGNMPRYSNIQELLFFLEKTSDVRFKVENRTVVVSDK